MARFAALLVALLVGGSPAIAKSQPFFLGLLQRDGVAGRALRGPEARAADDVRGGRLVPLARVIQQIEARSPGRLLDAALEDQGRPVYRVRWAANDGRRLDFVVDAVSGQIISAD